MKVFTHRVVVKAKQSRVAAFHQDIRTLKRLTMPPVIVQIHKVETITEGAIADFTLWLGPLPVRWQAINSSVNQLNGFTDSQSRGPFKKWVHQHKFNAIDETTTEIRDVIQAEFNSNLFWKIICWFMWMNLPVLFSYRGWVIKRSLEDKRTQ